jgi:hypothetical protein
VAAIPIRACDSAAVAAACAHDLNNELTIIVSGVTAALRILPLGDELRPLLLEIQQAANRCAWKASGLLGYSARKGAQPTPFVMESLIEPAA